MIAIVPVGDTSVADVAPLVPMLREAFGADVVTAPAVPLPEESYDQRRGQYASSVVLDALANARRPQWERLVGVASVDLYTPELNFVFGEADRLRAVAVFSLWRLRADEAAEGLVQRRAATEAIHELGHTYGLGHCRDARCVMWFSNTLAESGRKGSRFCAAHAAELRRARDPDAP